jgi:hypothetical protein
VIPLRCIFFTPMAKKHDRYRGSMNLRKKFSALKIKG